MVTMTKIFLNREKLVLEYELTRCYLNENIPDDFQKYIKKNGDKIFYVSFLEKESKEIPKETSEFLDTVNEKKPKLGDKK